MPLFLIALFVSLHGLVHLWYVVLSQRMVPFQPAMGWTGKSWIFTDLVGDGATRRIASVLLILAAAGFVASGIGLFAQTGWWPFTTIISSTISVATLILFWDGSFQLVVQKGLIGVLISAATLAFVLTSR